MTKSATNRKWTSSEKYRDNWDEVFRETPDDGRDYLIDDFEVAPTSDGRFCVVPTKRGENKDAESDT